MVGGVYGIDVRNIFLGILGGQRSSSNLRLSTESLCSLLLVVQASLWSKRRTCSNS